MSYQINNFPIVVKVPADLTSVSALGTDQVFVIRGGVVNVSTISSLTESSASNTPSIIILSGDSNILQTHAALNTTVIVTASITYTGAVGLTAGSKIFGVIRGNFTVTFAGTCFNANGATQCGGASGDGTMFSIAVDDLGRPVWSSNKLV